MSVTIWPRVFCSFRAMKLASAETESSVSILANGPAAFVALKLSDGLAAIDDRIIGNGRRLDAIEIGLEDRSNRDAVVSSPLGGNPIVDRPLGDADVLGDRAYRVALFDHAARGSVPPFGGFAAFFREFLAEIGTMSADCAPDGFITGVAVEMFGELRSDIGDGDPGFVSLSKEGNFFVVPPDLVSHASPHSKPSLASVYASSPRASAAS